MTDAANTLCPHGLPVEVLCAYCDDQTEPVVSEGWLRAENRRLRAALEKMVKAPYGQSTKGARSACRAAREDAEKLLADYIVPATTKYSQDECAVHKGSNFALGHSCGAVAWWIDPQGTRAAQTVTNGTYQYTFFGDDAPRMAEDVRDALNAIWREKAP